MLSSGCYPSNFSFIICYRSIPRCLPTEQVLLTSQRMWHWHLPLQLVPRLQEEMGSLQLDDICIIPRDYYILHWWCHVNLISHELLTTYFVVAKQSCSFYCFYSHCNKKKLQKMCSHHHYIVPIEVSRYFFGTASYQRRNLSNCFLHPARVFLKYGSRTHIYSYNKYIELWTTRTEPITWSESFGWTTWAHFGHIELAIREVKLGYWVMRVLDQTMTMGHQTVSGQRCLPETVRCISNHGCLRRPSWLHLGLLWLRISCP